jgi:hypothetical protein
MQTNENHLARKGIAMFQTLRKKNRSINVGQLLAGVSLLVLLSTAFAAPPRFGRTTRIATTPQRIAVTPQPKPSDRIQPGLRIPIVRFDSRRSDSTHFFGPGFRRPSNDLSTRPSRGNGLVIAPGGGAKPVLSTTKLQVYSTGQWRGSKTIHAPQRTAFRWKTGESSAFLGRWVMYNTRTPTERMKPIASGGETHKPASGQWVYFTRRLSDYLPAEGLKTSYWMRIVPVGKQGQTLGPASPWVRLHPPADLEATFCHARDLKTDYEDQDDYEVECHVQNVDDCLYEGNRTYKIMRFDNGSHRILKTGAITPVLEAGGTFKAYFSGQGGYSDDTTFAFVLDDGDANWVNNIAKYPPQKP